MSATVFTAAFNSNASAGGFSQRIMCTALLAGGTKLKITFTGDTSVATHVDHVSVGVQSTTANNMVSAPVEVLFSGASGFNIAAGQTIQSDEVALNCSIGDTLIVVMDFNATSGQRFATGVSGSRWYKAATASYNVQSPGTAGWTKDTTAVCVSQIDITNSNVTIGSTVFTRGLGSNPGSAAGYSIRSGAPSCLIANNGQLSRAIFIAEPVTGVTYNNIGFGVAAVTENATVDPPIELKFGGVSGLTLAPSATKASDPFLLDYTTANNLTCILDVNTGDNSRYAGSGDVNTYFKSATASYNVQNPGISGWTQAGSLYGMTRVQLVGIEGADPPAPQAVGIVRGSLQRRSQTLGFDRGFI